MGEKMSRILIGYYSKTGTTKKMAEEVAEGVSNSKIEVEVDLKNVEDVDIGSLLDYDALVLGSPTYYGTPAAEIKEFIDKSIAHHGDLEGMIGGAFSSSANTAGGNETTIISLLQNLLVHGMIIQGMSDGDHYGPVVVGKPEEEELQQCKKYGRKIAKLVQKLKE